MPVRTCRSTIAHLGRVTCQVEPSAQLYGELGFTLLRLGELDAAVENVERAIAMSGSAATMRMKQVLLLFLFSASLGCSALAHA